MIEKLKQLYAELLKKYSGGLSNTSINKFDDIKELFHKTFDIPIDAIYATGAGTRPGNLEVRLSQGVQATKHTVLGLAFLVDEKNSLENRKKLTNSTFTTVTKFLGRKKSSYDNILVLIQSEKSLFITGLIALAETEISNKLSQELNITDVRYVNSNPSDAIELGYNKIFFGAPGTGKSFHVDSLIMDVSDERKERITFHPEFDNSSFVGGYKPIYENKEIKYKFVPQIFTNIYVKSWNDLSNNYFLVIEEINRGNCAEIFGELFQLLDRNSNYTITPSGELSDYLNLKLIGLGKDGIEDGKMKLPPNLILLATMNTSDQSLFPMDSAFKRRWAWEYIPINYEETNEDGSVNNSYYFTVQVDGETSFQWIDFIGNVNKKIKSNPNLGMDKCIGNYFVVADNNEITKEEFINKVIFYLWNDVFKDEENNVFSKDMTYEDFFPISTKGVASLKELLKNIGIIQ